MAVVTETVTTNAGGGGDTTTAAAEGSLTKRLGGAPRRCLGGGCAMTAMAAKTIGGRSRPSPIRRKTPENAGKRRKTPKNAGKRRKNAKTSRKTPRNAANIVNWGQVSAVTKYLGGHGPLSPLKTFFLVSSCPNISKKGYVTYLFMKRMPKFRHLLLKVERVPFTCHNFRTHQYDTKYLNHIEKADSLSFPTV